MRTSLFYTDTGIKVPAITTDQMREVDRIAIHETGPNLFQMMENAGRSLAQLALQVLNPTWRGTRITILAGRGGNGGGGICAGRHLVNRGLAVFLFLTKPTNPGDVPDQQWRIFQSAGGKQVDYAALQTQKTDLVLDTLIGYGLDSAPYGMVAQAIQWANNSGASILSLDVPSGLNATTGAAPGTCIRADWTLTLALPKTGLLSARAGNLFLADIGIPRKTYTKAGLSYSCPFGNRFVIPLSRAKA